MKCRLDKLANYEDLDERGMIIRDGEPQRCFANITFDKDDLQKMVDEKIEDYRKDFLKRFLLYDSESAEVHIFDKGYDKAIDDFVAMLSRYAFSNEYGIHIVFTPEQLDEMVACWWKAGEK